MDSFLNTHIPLANKNSPIIISFGDYINENKFNTKITKNKINNIIYNLQQQENIFIRVNHTKGITEMNYGNYNFKYQRNNVEFNIINTKAKYINSNIFIRVLDVKKDSYVIPSINKYNSVESHDLMVITINNYIDLNIYDFESYYKCDIILKKPVKIDVLNNIITQII